MNKKIFIIRAIAWSIFACILPVVFIGWRYDIFKQVSKVSLSGWGLIAIIIIFAFLYAFIKYIRAGLGPWSMLKQVLNGVFKVLLPLLILLLICMAIKSNIEYFIQALGCVLICETIAIPVNPFPQWVYEQTKGRFESVIDMVANKFKGEE
jgi:hypothetical protein